MPITGTVPISDIIAPTSELDVYPVTDPKYGLGGLRTVGTTADRNAITTPRRQVGMVVYVSSLNKYYHLVGGTADSNWQEFVPGGAGAAAGPNGAVQFKSGESLSGSSDLLFDDAANRLVLGSTTVVQFGDGTTQGTARNFYGITGPTAPIFPKGMSGAGNTGDRLLIATGPSSNPFRNYVRFGNQWFQTGIIGVAGGAGIFEGDYVESLNSLTGALQISAGSNIQITVEGNDTLVITSLDATFDSDITASFAPEKSFGKYLYGQRVPSLGKTAVEVIRDALLDSVNPLATLTSSSTVAFNQTTIGNVLNVTHTIRTIGATGATGVLQWRRNNSGSWTTLNSSLFNSSGTLFSGSHTHTMTDTAFNVQPFNYRYIVFDSRGTSAEATLNITPATYQNPTGNLIQSATNSRGGVLDSDTAREKGNSTTTLSGTCNRTNSLVPITHYIIEYQENGSGGWTQVTNNPISGNPSTFSIPSVNHIGNTTLNSIRYRLRVSDTYIDSRVSTGTTAHTVETETPITFHNLIWYGPTGSPPTTSDHIRAGGLSAFNPGIITNNPFQFESGLTHINFVIAFPKPTTLTPVNGVVDLRSLNLDLTPNFLTANSQIGWSVLPFVNDYAGNSTAYNVYNYNSGNPYIGNGALFEVTRT